MRSPNQTSDQAEPPDHLKGRKTTGSRIVRRLPWLVLVAALASGVARHYQAQPSMIVVNYPLAEYRVGLDQMILSYRRGDEILRSIRYDFSAKPAPATITHRVNLPDGDYRIFVELYFRQKRSLPRMRALRLSDRAFRLTRPLPVHGAAEVRIVIGDES